MGVFLKKGFLIGLVAVIAICLLPLAFGQRDWACQVLCGDVMGGGRGGLTGRQWTGWNKPPHQTWGEGDDLILWNKLQARKKAERKAAAAAGSSPPASRPSRGATWFWG